MNQYKDVVLAQLKIQLDNDIYLSIKPLFKAASKNNDIFILAKKHAKDFNKIIEATLAIKEAELPPIDQLVSVKKEIINTLKPVGQLGLSLEELKEIIIKSLSIEGIMFSAALDQLKEENIVQERSNPPENKLMISLIPIQSSRNEIVERQYYKFAGSMFTSREAALGNDVDKYDLEVECKNVKESLKFNSLRGYEIKDIANIQEDEWDKAHKPAKGGTFKTSSCTYTWKINTEIKDIGSKDFEVKDDKVEKEASLKVNAFNLVDQYGNPMPSSEVKTESVPEVKEEPAPEAKKQHYNYKKITRKPPEVFVKKEDSINPTEPTPEIVVLYNQLKEAENNVDRFDKEVKEFMYKLNSEGMEGVEGTLYENQKKIEQLANLIAEKMKEAKMMVVSLQRNLMALIDFEKGAKDGKKILPTDQAKLAIIFKHYPEIEAILETNIEDMSTIEESTEIHRIVQYPKTAIQLSKLDKKASLLDAVKDIYDQVKEYVKELIKMDKDVEKIKEKNS